ncbi:MAG: hypothetical protein PPP58_09690 [Natronomonas sp.]
MDGDIRSFLEDTTGVEDLDPEARVCVVAVQEYTFEQCRNGFYPSPISYPRCRAEFECMAFYRTAPISAIRHVAPVTDRFVDDGSWMGPERWSKLIEPFSDDEEALVFELGELLPLSEPIENDLNGVRGAWYCSVADLRTVSTLSGLSKRSETD